MDDVIDCDYCRKTGTLTVVRTVSTTLFITLLYVITGTRYWYERNGTLVRVLFFVLFFYDLNFCFVNSLLLVYCC